MVNFLKIINIIIFSTKMSLAFFVFICLALGMVLPISYLYLRRKFKYEKDKNRSDRIKVGIFHPYSNAGGGGERVLWVAVKMMQQKYKNKVELYIYTGDVEFRPAEILENVAKRFQIKVENNIKFIYLHKRNWIEAYKYPFFTLLGQAIGSMYLGYEALCQLNPDVFIDTTGLTFTMPLFKYIGGCKTGSYIHYPTITKDMLKRVSSRQTIYNNSSVISRSPILTMAKLVYYHVFAWAYSLAGQCSDITLVNSTFTLEHLTELWNRPLHLVYPPCDTDHLKNLKRADDKPEKIRIMSLAQFRPEKDHSLQLQSMYELREIIPEAVFNNITLVLCGSCRNDEDSQRVKDLRDFSKHLSLENNVEFKVNLSYKEIVEELENSFIGIHTMLDEHFGISIVEQMAAGLIMVAHRSGGPLLDIIETSEGSRLGFLARTADEYAYMIKYIVNLSQEDLIEIRERARASVERFSNRKFEEDFLRGIDPLIRV